MQGIPYEIEVLCHFVMLKALKATFKQLINAENGNKS